jgi:hypothetical protein
MDERVCEWPGCELPGTHQVVGRQRTDPFTESSPFTNAFDGYYCKPHSIERVDFLNAPGRDQIDQ